MWNVISLILCSTRPLNCQLFYCGCALELLYDCWFYNINTQIRGFQTILQHFNTMLADGAEIEKSMNLDEEHNGNKQGV